MGQKVKADSVQHSPNEASLTLISRSNDGNASNHDDKTKENSYSNRSVNKDTVTVSQINTQTLNNQSAASNIQNDKVSKNNGLKSDYELVQKQQSKEIINSTSTSQNINVSGYASIDHNKDELLQASFSPRYLLTSFYAIPSSSPWHKVGDDWTFSKKDGTRAEEEWVVAPDGKWYYFDGSGNMAVNGWVSTNYNVQWKTYYFDQNGHYSKNAWHKVWDNWTFSKKDCTRVEEEWVVAPDKKWYYFDQNGHYSKNAWHKSWGQWTFSKKDGTRAEEEWIFAPDKKWYYFDGNGNMVANGWVSTYYNGSWKNYYFDQNGHYSKNAWHKVWDYWTFSKKDGTQAKDEWIVAPDGKWYYFDGSGNMAANGWVDTYYNVQWKIYYFDQNGHYVH